MAETNPAPTPAPNPAPVATPPAPGSEENPGKPGSETKPERENNGPTPAERKLQSDRDKARSAEKSTEEQLAELQEHVFGKEVREHLSTFLDGKKKEYPDLTVDDLQNAESLSDEHLEAEAKRVQGRFDKVRNDALKKVQEVPEQTMTETERAEALKNLEETGQKPGQSRFSQFLNLQRTKTR